VRVHSGRTSIVDGMADIRDVNTPLGVSVGTTLICVATVMGVAYLCDRTYRRWLRENHPLAEHRARMRRLSTGYQRKRSNVKEVVEVIADVLVEVARATSTEDAH
jgi:uncharacterized protein YneF (UPF0154 family)